jgi:hypothetical protein
MATAAKLSDKETGGNWGQTGSSPILRVSSYYEQDGPFQTVCETFRLSLSSSEFLSSVPEFSRLGESTTEGDESAEQVLDGE